MTGASVVRYSFPDVRDSEGGRPARSHKRWQGCCGSFFLGFRSGPFQVGEASKGIALYSVGADLLSSEKFRNAACHFPFVSTATCIQASGRPSRRPPLPQKGGREGLYIGDMELPANRPEKIKLKEINPYLTCYLCKGYLIDATTISECLHSFCRSCIIKFLQDNSFCPVCEVIINKAKPNLKLDKTLQDIVYKLVPELFLKEMTRRKRFYKQYPQIAARVSPEERGEDTERTIFNPQDCISLSMEYIR
ncbi:hypothetical protein NQ315_000131 [Exocentrus adspersus]|uniref:RING-type domain-containing protein n=1 Tax=Exocentrus adspersus TaxID=1586481 RepID=A0AAV8VQP0_9CUCU|nr:hypothetical protein NQ315_000131 [Exocentrus adspersus]